ncbi:hypothetical protein LTR99_010973 [Exophiala xenobiotica]|uniref:Uncharacterized protein n=1 Tax=Vermiconidia calcicola TaxID=1690605 RepID=A0AAV9QIT1_9PEZI|nr:hypothetical protein LTR47_010874 [Exophiala xenobiotica]KAK5541374.1 hypothetical protein LTR25_003151 [Vermiconidia calcicola]KAK5246967.1 hypothetical protein LTS06_007820 [Exophiala xenobiotica]KAK5261836.1 hypothetical protein LTR40_001472 [Exophiala xenobiotica]KAK5291057.1 hypothetical protein LTR99_010973 [Exophiala xenobiotica]
MTDMTIKPHTLQKLAWACGCSREGDSAFVCDGTCRLNERWTLHCAKDRFSGPGSTVAVLFSGESTYVFKWSDNNVILASFHSSRSPKPFTRATDLMALDWMHEELLEFPDTFTHSNLERAAVTEAVVRLRLVEASAMPYLQNDRTANSDGDGHTIIEDDYVDIDAIAPYEHDILPWEDWKPDNIIATLSGPAERGPLLQHEDSREQTLLYQFKLTRDDALTISTRHEEVETAWYESAERYKLQRDKGKDFKLTDVFCFLQADDRILTSISPEELAALKECVRILATYAVQRLEHPAFTLLRDRSPVLQCELHIFTLCLRKEVEEQSEMLIQFWFEDHLYDWTYGQIFQVMTTETQTSVDLTITHKREKKHMQPKYQILHHMSELNQQGVFFCCEGLGYAGKILVLPQEAMPPKAFQLAYVS